MKLHLPVALTIAAALGIAGTAAAATPALANTAPPHFSTPQSAMRYLAAAYNRHDVTAMHHVTTPSSFRQLTTMWSGPINLKLESCKATGRGDYLCDFRHDLPKNMHQHGYGVAEMIVAPAITPGWYLYAIPTCGG